MVVDDDKAFRTRLVRALRDRGHRVRGAANYDEAVTSAKIDVPDFAILDIYLPGRSGIDLALDLRTMLPTIRIVLLTSYRNTELLSADLGIVHISKPVDVDDILTAMARVPAVVRDRPPLTARRRMSMAHGGSAASTDRGRLAGTNRGRRNPVS
jgi:two-component system response regulator RegA